MELTADIRRNSQLYHQTESQLSRLLHFAKRPTPLCFKIMLLCVYFIVFNPHVICPSLLEKDFTSYMDNATAYFAMSLCCLLLLAALGIVWSLIYRTLRGTLSRSGGRVKEFVFRLLSVAFAACFCAVFTAGLFFVTRTAQSYTARFFSSSLLWMCGFSGSGTQKDLRGYDWSDSVESEKHFRYLSEDVKFLCEIEIPGAARYPISNHEYMYSLWWTFKGQMLNASSRVIFDDRTGRKIKFMPKQGDTTLTIRATLLLLRIRNEDYGEYVCSVRIWRRTCRKSRVAVSEYDKEVFKKLLYWITGMQLLEEGNDVDVPQGESDQEMEPFEEVTRKKESNFILDRTVFEHQDKSVYPGQRFSVIIIPWLMLHDEDDEIVLVHKINVTGAGLKDRTENRPDLCTHTNSFKYCTVDRLRGNDDYQKIERDPNLDTYTFCVQFEDYAGVHSFMTRRYFYNQNTQSLDFDETEFPITLSFRPSEELWGTYGFEETFFTECWDGPYFVPSARCVEWGNSMMSRALWWYCPVWRFIGLGIPLLIIFPYMKLTAAIFRFLLKGSFFPPVVMNLCGVQFQEAPFVEFTDPDSRYDVFLGYSEEDRKLADSVINILRSIPLSVFDCHMDVSPGEYSLQAWDQAISSCRSFVILASTAYTGDPELQAQFQAMYFRMLTHEVPEDWMLILPVGLCRIPPSVGPLAVIDPTDRNALRKLEWWAMAVGSRSPRTGIRRQLQRSFRGAAQDFLQSSKALHASTVDQAQLDLQKADSPVLGGPAFDYPDDAEFKHDVFLTYCEDSRCDPALAEMIKSHLQVLGLSVFDAVQDVLGGQEEVAVIAEAAQSASFVVLLSPAYRTHALTRRLVFPHVLQAVLRERVSVEHVLIIRTGFGTDAGVTVPRNPPQRRAHSDDTPDETIAATDHRWHARPRVLTGNNVTEDDGEENYSLPDGLQGFRVISWTGGLSVEDYLRDVDGWARPVVQYTRKLRRQRGAGPQGSDLAMIEWRRE